MRRRSSSTASCRPVRPSRSSATESRSRVTRALPARSPTSSPAGSNRARRARDASSMTRAERRAAQQPARAAALAERLETLLRLRGDERVLDVGCGTGALAYAVAERVREVVGIDNDAAVVAVARRSAPANVRFEVADGEQLPFGPGEFEVAGT